MMPEKEKSFNEVRISLTLLGFSEFLMFFKSDVAFRNRKLLLGSLFLL